MALFDQAQSPRLGQRAPVEATIVRMFTGVEIPEAAWRGQIIYRPDLQVLQIYNGEAWEDVVGGTAGILTFVGPSVPVSQAVGDIWFDSDDFYKMYVAMVIGADAIDTNEWRLVQDSAGALAAAQAAQADADNSISTYVVEYAVNASETVPPISGWSTTTPVRDPGEYIWFRAKTTRNDGTESTTSPALMTGNDGAQGPEGPEGPQGETGSQGIQGPPGPDGSSLYTWLKYADTPTTGMSDSPAGKIYMGLAYNKTSATESSTYGDYTWSLIQGPQGPQGVEGPPGDDGQPLYTWIKYADTPTTGMSDSPTGKAYIGLAFNKTTATESSTYADYAWSLVLGPEGDQGIQGPPGADGQSLFTWVKYADTPTTGMSDSPAGKIYIGLAYNKTSATESTNYADYSWSLIQGPEGDQGVQGPPGADGTTTYTWVKYADDAAGSGLSDSPTGKTYIGLAFNKTTATESTTPGDYSWSLIQGPQGTAGVGITGTVVTYQVHTNGTTAPTGTWQSSPQATSPGQFLWTRTVTSYSSGGPTTAYSVAAHGSTGSAGKGVSSTAVTYQVHSNGTTAPTGTWQSSPQATTTGQFLWTRTITTYTDASTTTAYSVAAHGATGSTGSTGAQGISITAVTPYFAQVLNTDPAPAKPNTATPPAPWVATEPAYVPGTAMYRTEKITFSSGSPGFDYTTVVKSSSYEAAETVRDEILNPVAEVAPTVTPEITVTPSKSGFTVVVDTELAATDSIEYLINDAVVAISRSTVLYLITDQSDEAFVENVDYAFKTRFTNSEGDGPNSNEVIARLDPTVDDEFIRGVVSAGLVVTGKIVMGQITMSAGGTDPETGVYDPGGIKIPIPDGVIVFPADGSDAEITAILNARSITIEDKLTLQGQDNTFAPGSVTTVGSGVEPPKTGPQITGVDQYRTIHNGFYVVGPAHFPNLASDRWLVTESLFGGGITVLQKTSNDDFVWIDNFDMKSTPGGGRTEINGAMGGIAVIGSEVFTLCDTTELYPGTSRGEFYIYQWHHNSGSTGTARFSYVRRWKFAPVVASVRFGGASVSWRPTLSTDGTHLFIAQTVNNNTWTWFKIDHFTNPSSWTYTYGAMAYDTGSNIVTARHMGGLVLATARTGSTGAAPSRWYLTTEGYTTVYAFNPTNWQRDTGSTYEFVTTGVTQRGIAYDGDRFHTNHSDGVTQRHSINTATSAQAVYTWRKSAGPGETTPSPITTGAISKRKFVKLTSAAIPTGTEIDSVFFYTKYGSQTFYHWTHDYGGFAVGDTTQTIDVFPSLGSDPEPPLATYGFGTATPAVVKSTGMNLVTPTQPVWRLSGDGEWRLGPWTGDNDGGLTFREPMIFGYLASDVNIATGTAWIKITTWTGTTATTTWPGTENWTYSSGTWTVPVDGLYEVYAAGHFSTHATNVRAMSIHVNGVSQARGQIGGYAGGGVTVNVWKKMNLAAGNTIDFHVFQNSGGTLALNGGISLTYYNAHRLGPRF